MSLHIKYVHFLQFNDKEKSILRLEALLYETLSFVTSSIVMHFLNEPILRKHTSKCLHLTSKTLSFRPEHMKIFDVPPFPLQSFSYVSGESRSTANRTGLTYQP